MKNKKLLLSMVLALGTVLLVGPTTFLSAHSGNDHEDGFLNMMNGNGMNQMMEAMDSPEGEEMIKACHNYMSSLDEKE